MKQKRLEGSSDRSVLATKDILEAAVESIPEYAIILLDCDGTIQSWNRGAELTKGYTKEEIIGKNFSVFYTQHAVNSGFPQYELEKALNNGKFEDEGWRVKKDGTLFWANVVITSIRDHNGNHIGFVKVTRDITLKNETEARLQALQCGIDCIVDYAIFMMDPLGKVFTWNKGAERMYAYTAQEIVGQPYDVLIPPELPDYAETALKTALKNGTFQDENWRVKKGGDRFWGNVIITAVFNQNGEHVGYCKVTKDLTEQKKAQEQLEELQKENEIRLLLSQEAERLRKQQSSFTDRICHEIRNPLNGIFGTLKLLEMDIATLHQQLKSSFQSCKESWLRFLERLENFVSGIKECAEHQKRIADEVLKASKMNKYDLQITNIPTKLKNVIQLSSVMFTHACAAKGLHLQVNLPDEELQIMTDAQRLKEVVTNLLSNALKFTSNGTITVTLNIQSVKNGRAKFQIIVQDTGIGMDDNELANLFKQFSQSSNYTSYSGSGLGLYISKQIIQLMGGSIEVSSKKGIGSTFTVNLECDLASETVLDAGGDDPPPVKKDFSEAKVLIAEDNIINQKILSKLLKQFGIRADIASNGVEAVIQAEKTKYDLIFMDILMPEMGGIEATKKILEHQNLPIVAVSGFGQEKDKLAAIQAGMVDYVVKPFVLEDLQRICNKYLGRSNL